MNKISFEATKPHTPGLDADLHVAHGIKPDIFGNPHFIGITPQILKKFRREDREPNPVNSLLEVFH
jgi:hypothetical protein